jgi:hypothetical protein
VTLIRGKVIKVVFTENILLELSQVKRIVKRGMEFSRGDKFCFLADCRQATVRFSPGSRNYLASHEDAGKRIADAVLVSTLTDKLIGDMYSRVHLPKVPTRFFTSEEEAGKWLKAKIAIRTFQLN